MLRTNSKEVKTKVRQYIMDGFDPEAYGYEQYYNVDKENFSCVAHAIYECLYNEKIKYDNRKLSKYEYFKDWMQGLCSMVDSSYYYNVSAIDLLADWLEETEEEKKHFTEDQAEEKITYLLYRELKSGCRFF